MIKDENNGELNFVAKYHDWLIPILALLVVFQTAVLISQLKSVKRTFEPYVALPPVEEVSQSAVKLNFIPSGVSLRNGDTVNVDLMLTPKKSLRLDGIDIVLAFDPKIVQVSQVITPKLFSFVSENKEKEKDGKIYLTLLEEKENGLVINQEVKLVTLVIKAKAIGESEISILTAEEGPTTVITENQTSKKILFDKGKAKVVVY